LGVIRIGLFGSFVREEQSRESDLDLLVEFDQGRKTFDNFIRLPFRRTFSGSFRRRPVDRTAWRIGNPVH
jgi:predicted nucleotidyltransferase